jgi:hypothetical protein
VQQLAVDTNNRLDNAEDLVADMANTFIQWGQQAPKDVSSTPWYQNMQKGMGPKLQAARNLTQQPSAEQCPANCLDLRVMTGGHAAAVTWLLLNACTGLLHPLSEVCVG